ncbi:MAG: ferrous iron transport protein B [Dysgonamonadaceae bacterium]|jgi:ferrous iron transport protein B|nr:ferrous iron transport protein B [Dysgonamonadaceae bacterium]
MESPKEEIRYLSDLLIGETAIIAKVKGYGAFRKRITEMGFVHGTRVKAIKKAPFPFQDPVEYELMGYRVSLRLSEAHMIEIVGEDELASIEKLPYEGTLSADDDRIRKLKEKGKTIQAALVGNPNSGKTSLFNYATGKQERVGNYGGVTVDIKTARFYRNGYRIDLTDLPGTYSISEYSPEERFVRQHLTETMPDVVINVIDASNLERNLFLTTQLIDMNIKVIIALNMYDELSRKGDRFDYEHLSRMLGIPVIPTIASKGKGIDDLMEKVIDLYEEKEPVYRHIHINYGEDINREIEKAKAEIKKNPALTDRFHSQYVAIKLLEEDKVFAEQIADAKYAFIRGALKETYHAASENPEMKGYQPDKLLTHKWWGIPIFLFLMWLMFEATFILGNYPVEWIGAGVEAINHWIRDLTPEGILRDLLTNGIIGGVGSVIVFLPNIIILFLCISLMEDTGYMARAAFIMDKLMHKIGLHGKSFIPMLMGFGCNVPAVMATRTLENRKDRLLTMLIIPFMSCSARLPVYILLISVFFSNHQGLVMFSIYAIGVLVAIVMAKLFNKIAFKKQDIPFVMELPPYRWPTLRNIGTHTWSKSVQYLQKMGSVILVASIIIWGLGYFPRNTDSNDPQSQLENSYIGRLGHFIEPVLQPLGYNWQVGISILTGMAAKEIVVGSMGVLYQSDPDSDENSATLKAKLQEQHTFTPLTAYSFMVFILLYFPCVAVLAAIRREGGLRWAVFTAFYTTAVAWLAAFGIYRIFTFLLYG